MNTKFRFDKKTGTIISSEATNAQKAEDAVQESKTTNDTVKPEFSENKSIGVKSAAESSSKEVIKMKRVDGQTSIQLINEQGLPEAYLDSLTSGIMMFREREDYDICQIADEKTGKILAMIGGYALQINFNMAELTTLERIEECLQGLVKLFRHKLMTQAIGK